MTSAADIRIAPATDADRAALDAYLASRSDTCLTMRSNLSAVGLAWTGGGALYQAEYALAWHGDRVTGVVGHAWNGLILVQADAAIAELATAAVARSGRAVTGFLGPYDQVVAVRGALGLAAAPALSDGNETLLALGLADLVLPPALAAGAVHGRRGDAPDRDVMIAWRAAYLVETSQVAPGETGVAARAADAIDRMIRERRLWVLEADGAPVATCTINAQLPDAVQIGGVYTPPALRGRGHARAIVAAALLDARTAGVARAILFTPSADALAAYRAIGFEPIGRYGLILLAPRP